VDVSRKQRIFNPAHMPNWWFTTAPIVAALATVGIAFGVGYAFSSPSPVSSPTHVAAVFADGFRNGDFRQVCTVIDRPKTQSVAECARNLASGTGVTDVTVKAHSVREWTESYRGREARLAYVAITVYVLEPNFTTLQYDRVPVAYRVQLHYVRGRYLIYAITVPGGQA
jgi:hypothetical protein